MDTPDFFCIFCSDFAGNLCGMHLNLLACERDSKLAHVKSFVNDRHSNSLEVC